VRAERDALEVSGRLLTSGLPAGFLVAQAIDGVFRSYSEFSKLRNICTNTPWGDYTLREVVVRLS